MCEAACMRETHDEQWSNTFSFYQYKVLVTLQMYTYPRHLVAYQEEVPSLVALQYAQSDLEKG